MCVTRIFREGEGGGECACTWAVKVKTSKGAGPCSLGKTRENLDCLGLHFARFDGGERECRVVKRRSELLMLGL